MSINYTQLWAQLGKLVKWSNIFIAFQGTQLQGSGTNGEANDILSQYESSRSLVPNFQNQVNGQTSAVAGWVGALSALFNITLQSLQSALVSPNNNVNTILPLLYNDMVTNTQTMLGSTIASPSISVTGSNIGNGQLIVSKKNNLGQDDQRIINETVDLVCTADQFNGTAAGAEQFSINGLPQNNINGYLPLGNGAGPTLRVADSQNLILNGNFETFSIANTPNNWTTVGTIGTNITKNTSLPHSGLSAVSLNGDGTTATISLTQNVSSAVNQTTKIYAMGIWLRKNGTVSSGSTLTVNLTGTGFSTVTLFAADPSTLTTSYVFYSTYFPTGIEIPSNFQVSVAWTSANTAGASAVILVDDFVIAIPSAFGFSQYSIFRGSIDFLKGDKMAVTTAATSPAVWSSYFSRFYDWIPPTVTSGNTVAEALAE